jgi:hypothetical protein
MDDRLKQKLLKEIEKSGFSLEIAVLQKLWDAELIVFPNLRFIARDDKPHEIDAFVMLRDDVPESSWPYGPVGLNLLVECKASSEKPWIFFSESYDFIAPVTGLVDRLECASDIVEEPYKLLTGCNNTALNKHHYNSSVPMARTYLEAFGRDAGKEIYQAVATIWAALDYYRGLFKSVTGRSDLRKMRTIFSHGVVVFRGTLVVAEKQGDSFQLSEQPHVILRTTDCLTDNYFPFRFSGETIIDVVREDYLEQYLSICQEDLRAITAHLLQLSNAGWLSNETHASDSS